LVMALDWIKSIVNGRGLKAQGRSGRPLIT